MKYFLSFLTLVFACTTSYSQLTISSQGSCLSYTLTATMTGLTPTASGITVDDGWSAVIPIGFTYNFYGTNHTQCIIGSNGELGFNTANAGMYNTWPIGSSLAGAPADVKDLIAGPWCDIYIPGGGTLMYSLVGTAPNRKFEATFCGEAMYYPTSCPGEWITSQIIIYEGTNIAEVHIGHHTVCTAWNSGRAVCGVVNASGSASTIAPGRDWTPTWTATNEGWRFTPNAGYTAYTVTSIPYAPIPYASSAIYWYDSATHTYLGTGTTVVVTPSVTTTYMAAALGCGDTTKAYITVGAVGTGTGGGIPHISNITRTNALACGACNGTIKLWGITPGQIDTVFWTIGGVPQPTFVITTPPDSTWTITGLCAGTYTYYVKVGNCISNTVSATITAPILAISSDNSTNPTVCGKCDGSFTLHGLWPDSLATVNYTNSTGAHVFNGTVLPDSSITIPNLCDGSYTGISATIGLCTAQGNPLTITNPPPFPASFTYTTKLHCDGDEINLTNTSTLPGYNSTWSFSDGTANVTTTDAIHIFADNLNTPIYTGTITVTLIYNEYNNPACSDTVSQTIPFDHHIDAQITAIKDDTSICLFNTMYFFGNSTNNYVPTYTWSFGDGSQTVIGTPNAPGSLYTGADSTHYQYLSADDFTVKLTVSDTIGCKWADSAHVHVVSVSVRTFTHDTSVCLADSMMMRALVTIQPKNKIIDFTGDWAPTNNIGNNTFTGTGDGIFSTNFFGIGEYTYTVTANSTYPYCSASDNEVIHSYPPITLTNLTANQTIPWGSSIQLNADGAVYYTWAPTNGSLDNPNINNPVAVPFDSVTTYTVYGMSIYGCLDSAHITISLGNMTEFVPSAFTPNGDGLNDVFRITNMSFQRLVDFRIFNRWGQQVFQTANREKGWDGTWNGVPQDMGVYTYHIVIGLVDGTTKSYQGTVTLIR